jgi:uncharacterized membrane protein YeaQ/YmgE (transglycosylase-associated protein family)
MNWINYLLWLALTGLLVGGLARLVLPGREAIGIFGTILAGIAGSFVGGIVARWLFGAVSWWVGLALAVAGAVLFILPYRVFFVPTAPVVVDQPVVVDRDYARPGLFGGRRRRFF